jgi:hypothetical protein
MVAIFRKAKPGAPYSHQRYLSARSLCTAVTEDKSFSSMDNQVPRRDPGGALPWHSISAHGQGRNRRIGRRPARHATASQAAGHRFDTCIKDVRFAAPRLSYPVVHMTTRVRFRTGASHRTAFTWTSTVASVILSARPLSLLDAPP